jgi:hypothetical protein
MKNTTKNIYLSLFLISFFTQSVLAEDQVNTSTLDIPQEEVTQNLESSETLK